MSQVDPNGLDKIVAEISKDVEEKISLGEISQIIENEIRSAYLEIVPGNNPDEDLSRAIKRAEEASLIDLVPPLNSHKKSARYAKLAISKVVAWYMNHVGGQLKDMGLANNQVNLLLAERIRALSKNEQDQLSPAILAQAPRAEPVAFGKLYDVIAQDLKEPKSRVEFLGLPADLNESFINSPSEKVRVIDDYMISNVIKQALGSVLLIEDPASHLKRLGDKTLSLLVASRFLDDLGPVESSRLLDQSISKLRGNGRLALITWAFGEDFRSRRSVLSELVQSDPVSGRTWLYLMLSKGYHSISLFNCRGELVIEQASSGTFQDTVLSGLDNGPWLIRASTPRND